MVSKLETSTNVQSIKPQVVKKQSSSSEPVNEGTKEPKFSTSTKVLAFLGLTAAAITGVLLVRKGKGIDKVIKKGAQELGGTADDLQKTIQKNGTSVDDVGTNVASKKVNSGGGTEDAVLPKGELEYLDQVIQQRQKELAILRKIDDPIYSVNGVVGRSGLLDHVRKLNSIDSTCSQETVQQAFGKVKDTILSKTYTKFGIGYPCTQSPCEAYFQMIAKHNLQMPELFAIPKNQNDAVNLQEFIYYMADFGKQNPQYKALVDEALRGRTVDDIWPFRA